MKTSEYNEFNKNKIYQQKKVGKESVNFTKRQMQVKPEMTYTLL